MRTTPLISALALLAVPLGAQTVDRPTLTLDGAKRVIAAAESYARQHQTTGVVAVVDDGGNLMALERIDDTFAAGANISVGKARTAVLFKKPTKFFEDVVKNGRTAMVALNDFTPLQGGVPIVVDGKIVGGVGVSGAASAQQDEELAMAGAAALGASESAAVSYWSKDQVDAAFAKGAVLFDGAGDRNYMVHASRRDGPGQVEVHTKDTDIIHVLDGSATFVTGGTMVDGKHTAADEIRGASVTGGTTRTLTKGDVVIVPNGTPHWFRQVRGPFTYYVVKVR
jgi:glc operon protein GlcG